MSFVLLPGSGRFPVGILHGRSTRVALWWVFRRHFARPLPRDGLYSWSLNCNKGNTDYTQLRYPRSVCRKLPQTPKRYEGNCLEMRLATIHRTAESNHSRKPSSGHSQWEASMSRMRCMITANISRIVES